MTTSKQGKAKLKDDLIKEFADESIAGLKAQGLELLRRLATRQRQLHKTRSSFELEQKALDDKRDAIFDAYTSGDSEALDRISAEF